MKILLTIALYGVLAGLIATRPRADDIDIYLAGFAGAADSSCADAAVPDDVVGAAGSLVAPSVPVNGPADSASGQDIYFSLFQPEPSPLWPGNIKKLKIAPPAEAGADSAGRANPEIVAEAPTGRAAISTEDGQILPDALTFWTDPLGSDVLAFDPGRQEVPGRDGRSVTRGGAGQQVPGFLTDTPGASNSEPGARQLYTLDPDEPGELLAFDAVPATLDALATQLDPTASLSDTDGLELMRWIRGQDSFDADADGDRYESRRWLLGDLLHSRPLAIGYGTRPGSAYSASNPDIRIFFGTNDGIFHLLRNTTPSGEESGQETWAFIPPELLNMQSALARNGVGAGQSHPYGLDGEAVSVIRDRDGDGNIESDDGDSVLVVIGQRRGGRGLYAFDMTDPDTPRFQWLINHETPGFEQLALTFSAPRVARLDLGEEGPTTVLVFGGGYNGGWADGARVGKDAGASVDRIGNAIYVVNPLDGSLVWRAVGPGEGAVTGSGEQVFYAHELTDSIPSAVAVIDSDHNGVDDRAYVGDSGGNVWRIELTEHQHRQAESDTTDADNWYITRLATLGGAADSDRRFFHAPDVVHTRDGSGDYDGVLIVSGNRAEPREKQVRNFAYLLKDRRTAGSGGVGPALPGAAIGHEDLADVTGACLSSVSDSCIAADLAPGWKLALQAPGEKGLSAPLISNGAVVFTSYVPAGTDAVEDSRTACSADVGFSRMYWVSLGSGSPALPLPGSLTPGGEGEHPSAGFDRFRAIGPGLHGDVVPYHDQVLIPGTGSGDASLLFIPGRDLWRTYWREEEVDAL